MSMIYVKTHDRIITYVEGTGDNFLDEDIAEGYNDYWLSSVYKRKGEYLELVDSGLVLTKKMISTMDIDEEARHILEYWGMYDTDYIILDKENNND